MQMHSMILGDSDAGKTWVVLNILLHEASPCIICYETIIHIHSTNYGDLLFNRLGGCNHRNDFGLLLL